MTTESSLLFQKLFTTSSGDDVTSYNWLINEPASSEDCVQYASYIDSNVQLQYAWAVSSCGLHKNFICLYGKQTITLKCVCCCERRERHWVLRKYNIRTVYGFWTVLDHYAAVIV